MGLKDSVLIYRQRYGIKSVLRGHGHMVYHMAPPEYLMEGDMIVYLCACEFTVLNAFICPFVEV